MKKICIAFLAVGFFIASCDLQENPVDAPSVGQVFSSIDGIEKYTNSFNSVVPIASDITHGDRLSDYMARKTVPELLRGTLNSRTVDRWSWGKLRNINYFLQKNNNDNISKDVRTNYNGIARFYRAWFYFKKVKRYGEVPWINKPLDIDSKELKASRDSRKDVMDSVLADIDYAIKNIEADNESSRTKITRDVALALKSRIALFEGTYRKYHTELKLENSASRWLKIAVSASENIMNSNTYSIYDGEGVEQSYRQLFTSDKPVSSSVLLTNTYSEEFMKVHDANWWYNSGTYGFRSSLIRPFINTYLMRDGTPFTDKDNYKTMIFTEEVKNRDTRLQQSIRMPSYMHINRAGKQVPAPPNFSYTLTGYHPIKWSIANEKYNSSKTNTNSVPIFRYAEILLNYAEAKAELGTITNVDWNKTIGALRRRAGITGGTKTLPARVDPYLQETYFPNISNPIILEIRRSRSIELAMEGFRFDDIRRWERGNLMEMKWKGMYVPKANSYIDLTENGKPDVYFYTDKKPENAKSDVQYIYVGEDDLILTNGNSGNLVVFPSVTRKWSQKKYLYPLNEKDLNKNENLKQNPGW